MISPLLLCIIAAGAGAVVAGVWLEWMNRRAAGWPSVEASVTCSERLPDPMRVGSTAEFQYRFTVNGDCFESSRVSFAVAWPSEEGLLRLVARFPVGQRLTAWYDPQHPSTAVIERPARSGGIGLAVAGAILVIAAALI